jgi:hydroxyacylglutathione hydrolase
LERPGGEGGRVDGRAHPAAATTVAFAADTHPHADFLSGARQLAANEGATVAAAAAGHREFAHRALCDGDEVNLGGLRLRALATAGHTHQHLSFLLLDGDAPIGVFTGGSLLVGAAAHTDLVSAELTEPLARAQYRSQQWLLTLSDATAVWPTHGAGSFCSAPPGASSVPGGALCGRAWILLSGCCWLSVRQRESQPRR